MGHSEKTRNKRTTTDYCLSPRDVLGTLGECEHNLKKDKSIDGKFRQIPAEIRLKNQVFT